MDIFEVIGFAALAGIGIAYVCVIVAKLRRERAARWRPIKTAPRDGTLVLLAFGRDTVSMGAWAPSQDGEWPWRFIEYGPRHSELIVNGTHKDPSHWMPAPAGPFAR